MRGIVLLIIAGSNIERRFNTKYQINKDVQVALQFDMNYTLLIAFYS